MKCKYCSKTCVRRGIRNGTQQFFCTTCRKYQRQSYRRTVISPGQQQILTQLNNESMGIRSISQLLRIAASSVVKYLGRISSKITIPKITAKDCCYEIDEMQTYIGKNIPAIGSVPDRSCLYVCN